MQLVRSSQRLTTLFNCFLALQTMACWRDNWQDYGWITSTSSSFQKKKPQWTTLIIIDSQAVKNTCNASIESKGFCFYKATNGIKRHLAVDSLGLPFFTHCTKANITDDQGLIEMLTINIDYFKSKPVELPKTTILLDNGYHPQKIEQELTKIYPEIMTKIQFELSAKPSKAQKQKQGKSGFVPVKARWVIERSNSWMERCIHFGQKFWENFEKCTDKNQSMLCQTDAEEVSDRLTRKIPNGFYRKNKS